MCKTIQSPKETVLFFKGTDDVADVSPGDLEKVGSATKELRMPRITIRIYTSRSIKEESMKGLVSYCILWMSQRLLPPWKRNMKKFLEVQ